MAPLDAPTKPDPKLPTTPTGSPFTIGATGYPSLAAALSALQDGQTLEIAPGRYPGHCGRTNANDVVIQCAAEAILNTAAEDKAALVLGGTNVTVRGLAGENIVNSGDNGGLIRYEGKHPTFENIRIDHCQTGILTSPAAESIVRLRNVRGTGNGTPGDGQSHAIYIGECAEAWADGLDLSDTIIGHLYKSRALKNVITRAKLVEGRASMAIDLCRGGYFELSDSYLKQTQATDNSAIIGYGTETGGLPAGPLNEVHIGSDVMIFDQRSPPGTALFLKLRPDVVDVHYQLNPSIDPFASDGLFEGNLDLANSAVIFGWAWDITRPSTPIEVQVLVDGVATKIMANAVRADLVAAGKGNGRHGFSFPTPDLSKDFAHEIAAEFPNNAQLQGSPKSLTIRTPPPPGSSNSAWPAWRQRFPLWTPTAIPNTAPATFNLSITREQWDSYSAAVINPANGKAYHAAGGGHAIVNGDQNGVAAADFTNNAPTWSMLRQASGGRVTDGSGAIVTQTGGYFLDGSPVGSHLYSTEFVCDLTEECIVRIYPAEGGYAGGGSAGGDAACFRIAARDWDAKGVWPSTPFGGPEVTSAIDRRTQRIYFMARGTQICMLDPLAKRYLLLANNNGWGSERVGACVVPQLNAVLYDFAGPVRNNPGAYLSAYNIGSNSFSDLPAITWRRGERPTGWLVGLFYSERLAAVFATSGTNLYRIQLADWTGSLLSDQLPDLPDSSTQMYKRIDDVPALGGILMIPGYASAAYFIATE